jgi:hypothetical protein
MTNPQQLCPSAQPNTPGAMALGVLTGTVEEPYFTHFQVPQVVTDELLALAQPVTPTEVFRFSAPCAERKCIHFDGESCQLVKNVINQYSEVTHSLPRCHIRSTCRWWQQEGASACLRCPQIVTDGPQSVEPSV